MITAPSLPTHIGIIVDGNRRWARKRGFSEIKGHRIAVEEVIDKLISHAEKRKIKFLTFWCFSTENWKRGRFFAKALFSLLEKGIRQKAEAYHRENIRLKVIGDLDKLPKKLQEMLGHWQEKTKNNKKITVVLAINYGGRDEIVRACQRVLKSKVKSQKSKINKEEFEKYLDTYGIPDPEMIIRTGGEHRVSGFLLWQAEYSELYFTDVLFPDFGIKEFDQALEWYSGRQRRFGK